MAAFGAFHSLMTQRQYRLSRQRLHKSYNLVLYASLVCGGYYHACSVFAHHIITRMCVHTCTVTPVQFVMYIEGHITTLSQTLLCYELKLHFCVYCASVN